MAVLVHQLIPPLHDVGKRLQADLFPEPVGVGDVELEPDHHSQHPHRHLRCPQQLWLVLADVDDLAGRGHQADFAHDPGQAGVADAGAMGGGRHRPGDLLGVDVALIAQRQPRLP